MNIYYFISVAKLTKELGISDATLYTWRREARKSGYAIPGSGARLAKACEELGISVLTYECWVSEGQVKEDQRPLTKRPEPENKLSEEEKQEILEVIKKEELVDLPPSQILPKLALKHRQNMYEQAKLKHPERWSRQIRDWNPHFNNSLKKRFIFRKCGNYIDKHPH